LQNNSLQGASYAHLACRFCHFQTQIAANVAKNALYPNEAPPSGHFLLVSAPISVLSRDMSDVVLALSWWLYFLVIADKPHVG
jgi:hypothetical protein